ncbi:hypothetical protein GBO60_09015 [Pediococcus acidilactici]|nr:hypothetical protein CYD95_02730 [Pediococcus acidilactici]KAF0369918.1 hypothetical protein GBO60_09015 [Pediococcus acidilactici]KAF0388560.1 hypothetical protein GBO67_09015 [Pediococcus acidilactici]
MLFWRFDFNKVETCAKSHFISLNQKTSVMPNLGITLVFLILANYQPFVPRSFWYRAIKQS